MASALDSFPGYRRRFKVVPESGKVAAALEDDFHCMLVTLRHDGETIQQATGVMERWPWTTCPGAQAVLKATFEGVKLDAAASRGEKRRNCTHLHDLALLAAAHAHDDAPTTYDILVSDPVDRRTEAEIRRGGSTIMRFVHEDSVLIEPAEVEGVSLFKLRSWIDSLNDPQREAARLLQWATIVAHGRQIPMEDQSDATRVPPNCYTFQPEQAVNAVRIGEIIDFSASDATPLDHFDGAAFHKRES